MSRDSSEPKWTKGPWKVCITYEKETEVDPLVYKPPGFYSNIGIYSPSADVWPVACYEYDVFESGHDVLLIAAAPELYEALKQLVYECRNEGWGTLSDGGPDPFLAAADAALAKARGEQ